MRVGLHSSQLDLAWNVFVCYFQLSFRPNDCRQFVMWLIKADEKVPIQMKMVKYSLGSCANGYELSAI